MKYYYKRRHEQSVKKHGRANSWEEDGMKRQATLFLVKTLHRGGMQIDSNTSKAQPIRKEAKSILKVGGASSEQGGRTVQCVPETRQFT